MHKNKKREWKEGNCPLTGMGYKCEFPTNPRSPASVVYGQKAVDDAKAGNAICRDKAIIFGA